MSAGWEQCRCASGPGIEDIYARYARLFAAAFHGAQMPETLTDAERAFMEQRGILEHPRERRLMLLRDFLRDLQFAHQQHFQSGEHQAWLDREDQRATQAFRAAQRTDALSGDVYAGLNQSQTNEHRRLDAQRATERLRERR